MRIGIAPVVVSLALVVTGALGGEVCAVGPAQSWSMAEPSSGSGTIEGAMRSPYEGLPPMSISLAQHAGMSALSWASVNGDDVSVTRLLTQGAAVDETDQDGLTPLMWAARVGQVSTMEVLLGAGANKDAKDNYGNTALIWASREGRLGAVNLLLQRKVDGNSADKDGVTALMWSVLFGQLNVVKALVEYGVDLNAKDRQGKTAMAYAKGRDREAILKLLKQE